MTWRWSRRRRRSSPACPFMHFFDGFPHFSHEVNTLTLIWAMTRSASHDRRRAWFAPIGPGRSAPTILFVRGTAQNPDVFFPGARGRKHAIMPPCPESSRGADGEIRSA